MYGPNKSQPVRTDPGIVPAAGSLIATTHRVDTREFVPRLDQELELRTNHILDTEHQRFH